MTDATIQVGRWDRVVDLLAHPIRALCWMLALGVLLGPIGGAWWLTSACLAVCLGTGFGHLAGKSRVRTPIVLTGLATVWASYEFGAWLGTEFSLIASLLGPTTTHNLIQTVGVGLRLFCLLSGVRFLATRGPAFNVVELASLSGVLVLCVASHRDGSMARPLWLSDLCWSFGIDPGTVLLVAGGLLTGVLACLLLVGADRRRPAGSILLLPILAAAALFISFQLPITEPPNPEAQLDMDAMGGDGNANDAQGDESEAPGDPEDEEDSQGQSGEDGDEETAAGAPTGEGESGSQDGEPSGKSNETPPDPMAGGGGGGENQPVAVVLLDDDYVPESGTWYLRQDVLPAFNGTRMVPSDVEGAHGDILAHFPSQETPLPHSTNSHTTTVHGSISLLAEHPNPFAPTNVALMSPRGNPNPARFKVSYLFESEMVVGSYAPFVRRPPGNPTWSDELREHLLEGPDDPRYDELLEEILAELAVELDGKLPEGVDPPPLMKAAAVAKYIGDNMAYDRRERHAGVPDPTADFLFGNRIGYCVHTAHAATYLWRRMGIPARVATGYAVEESTRRGGTLVVMGSDAHAWPELYLEGVGWIPLDIAPAVDNTPPSEPGDEPEIAMLGDMARNAPDLPGPRPDYSWIWPWLTSGALLSFILLVLFLAFAHVLLKVWRRTIAWVAPTQQLPRLAYRIALDRLLEAGLPREDGESRDAYARRHAPYLPSLSALTALHQRGTLGRPGQDDPEYQREVWSAHLAHLKRELAEHVPFWRRCFGLLDPTTSYRIH